MKRFIFLVFILFSNLIFAQKCKVWVQNKSAYFYELTDDSSKCAEDYSDSYYHWSGNLKNGLLDGKGILKEYDKDNNKLISTTEVSFADGLMHGTAITRENIIFETKEKTLYVYGIEKETYTETVTDDYTVNSYYNHNTGSLYYFHKGKEYHFQYYGQWNKTLKGFNGQLFINGLLSEEGFFKPMYYNELDTSFPLDYHSFCNLKTGTKYFPNGIKVTANEFIQSRPVGCANLYYPNGDSIYSCDFNGSIFLTGNCTYKWKDGRWYEGTVTKGSITSEGLFYDNRGNKNYGSFPVNDNKINLLGIAKAGLIAYGIYELFNSDHKEKNMVVDSNAEASITANDSYKSSSTYTGSYTTYNNSHTANHETKCSSCGGRGVCTGCNGRGENICYQCKGTGHFGPESNIWGQDYDTTCDVCKGIGHTKCYDCYGSGSCQRCKGKGVL